jgi:hypothetical protein
MANYVKMSIGNGSYVTELSPDDRIIRKASIDYYNKIRELDFEKYEIWDIQHFYKGNIDEIKAQNESFDLYEKAFLFSVIPYIGYDDCCLKWANNKCINISGLEKITLLGKKLGSVISGLRRKDIIYEGRNSAEVQYFMNPWLFCRGNKINVVLKTMFKNYRVRVMNGAKWGDM